MDASANQTHVALLSTSYTIHIMNPSWERGISTFKGREVASSHLESLSTLAAKTSCLKMKHIPIDFF